MPGFSQDSNGEWLLRIRHDGPAEATIRAQFTYNDPYGDTSDQYLSHNFDINNTERVINTHWKTPLGVPLNIIPMRNEESGMDDVTRKYEPFIGSDEEVYVISNEYFDVTPYTGGTDSGSTSGDTSGSTSGDTSGVTPAREYNYYVGVPAPWTTSSWYLERNGGTTQIYLYAYRSYRENGTIHFEPLVNLRAYNQNDPSIEYRNAGQTTPKNEQNVDTYLFNITYHGIESETTLDSSDALPVIAEAEDPDTHEKFRSLMRFRYRGELELVSTFPPTSSRIVAWASGGTFTAYLTTSETWKLSRNAGNSWISVSPTTGTAGTDIPLTVTVSPCTEIYTAGNRYYRYNSFYIQNQGTKGEEGLMVMQLVQDAPTPTNPRENPEKWDD